MLYRPHLHMLKARTGLTGLCVATALAACSSSAVSQADAESGGQESAEAGAEASTEASTEGEDSESESTGEPVGFAIVPGASVGPVTLESTFGEAVARLGEPDLVFVTDAVGFARFDDLGMELVFASPEASAATDDSIIFAIGVKQSAGFTGGLLVGQSRSEVEAVWGTPTDEIPGFSYYGEGISAKFDANDEVDEVGVFAVYENASEAPEMANAPAGGQP